jgi:hypothetical protein
LQFSKFKILFITFAIQQFADEFATPSKQHPWHGNSKTILKISYDHFGASKFSIVTLGMTLSKLTLSTIFP